MMTDGKTQKPGIAIVKSFTFTSYLVQFFLVVHQIPAPDDTRSYYRR